MNKPVAVIVPTFNREATPRRALESVYEHSILPNEVCVVDDGSTENTRELVESSFPGAIYIGQENQGVSAARNVGVRSTSSDWLAYRDSDDEYLPRKIAQLIEALEESPVHRVLSGDELVLEQGATL